MNDQTINDGNTPGSLSPEVADYFKTDQTEVVPPNEEVKSDDKDEKSVVEETTKENDLEKKEEEDIIEDKKDDFGPVGKLSVEEINLPTRVANALIKAGYDTVEDLAKAEKAKLVKVRNLGEKSVKIIEAALGEKGLAIGK